MLKAAPPENNPPKPPGGGFDRTSVAAGSQFLVERFRQLVGDTGELVVQRGVPSRPAPVTMASAMRAAIRPYSMGAGLAPDSSLRKLCEELVHLRTPIHVFVSIPGTTIVWDAFLCRSDVRETNRGPLRSA